MRKIWRKALAYTLAITMCFNTVNVPVYAQENTVLEVSTEMEATEGAANTKEGTTDGTDGSTWDRVTTKNVFEGENYRVTFTLTSHWDTSYNANVKLENTGDRTIQNWYLGFDYNNSITNIWNAEISSNKDREYVIKNVGWNQDIATGNSVEFGISGDHAFRGFPENYKLIGTSMEITEDDYTIQYIVDGDWGTGFYGSISITNNTDTALEDWVLEFDFNREITEIWNGVIEEHEGNHYVVRNAEYNSAIVSGERVSIGIKGANGKSDDKPINYKLYSFEFGDSSDIELIDGKIDRKYLEQAIYPYLLMRGISVEDIKLSDDFDEDGLSLEEEYIYDTNPFSKDTDEDGLSDYDEIYIYMTNPIKSDTDEDGMTDGTEISCGLNPVMQDTDGDGVEDGQESILQNVRINTLCQYELEDVGTLPMIQITGKGDYSTKMYATTIQNNKAILGIDCLVGTPFEFVHSDEMDFESSKLSFVISDKILSKYSLDELAIAWYNEEENALELLDTSYDSAENTIMADVTHYSAYMVVSVPDYFFNMDWENADNIIESGKADVVFVVDTTGSMGNEIQNVKNCIEKFVLELEENKVDIRLGLVEYRDIYADGVGSTKSYDWYNDVLSFKQRLSNLRVGGGGDTPESVVDALYCARNMKYRNGVKKYIILLTDANYKNGTSVDAGATLSDEIEKLVDEEVVTSVVTTPYYYTAYKELVSETDGVSANININFATALRPLIEKMGKQVNEGCWVRLSDGSIVSLDKDPSLGDETVDTDKDGVPDVIELKSSYKVSAYNPYTGELQEIDTWSYYSNPVKADTDGDGLSDVDDLEPTVYDTVVIEDNENVIKFNTGKVWNKISCTSFDYLDNLMYAVDLHADNPIPIEEFRIIVQNVTANEEQDFSIEELMYIGIRDNEGSKLYMHNMTNALRETVFQGLTERESKYYQHTGILWSENWNQVAKGTEGGFFKGAILSEADINFSWKLYSVTDVYTVLDSLVKIGAMVIVIVVVAEATPVVLANIQGLVYYVKTFGVIQGIQMYRYLGIQNLPNGVITWIQMDTADGDSSLDDMVGSNIPIHKRGIPGEERLKELHPGESQVYFQTLVNGNKGGRYVDQLSGGIAYEAKVGYTCLSERVRMQVLKDAYLLQSNLVDAVVWEFFRSEITGEVGATQQLLDFLTQNGIQYIIHP